jgi:hypothetical protein
MAKTRRRFSRSKNMMKRGFKTSKKGFKRGFKKGFKVVTTSSRKYMPKVKSGLENVGSNVTKSATKSVPILQKASRDLLGVFGLKKSTFKKSTFKKAGGKGFHL